ncbi:unnamed protein product [Scytosiphon promiscuus]
MEVTHAKGTLYPALQLSSFRVRRDSLPPAFELPPEVSRAVEEPLPEVRSVALAREALMETERLLKEDEREREETNVKVAREQALMEEELTRIVEETEASRAALSTRAEREKKTRDLMSLMGLNHPSAAKARLEQCGWDYSKAVTSFLETVN